jgi:hypothetical protein
VECEIQTTERIALNRPASRDDGLILFERRWWLDAVAPGQWREIVQETDNGQVRLPYVLRRWNGFTGIVMPRLTPQLGPFLPHTTGKYSTRLKRELELFGACLQQLPRTDFINYWFSPTLTSAYPITWAGLFQSTGYTYRLDLTVGTERLWTDMSSDTRKIVRAQRQIRVDDDLDIESFIELSERMFSWKKMPNPYPPEVVRRIDRECAARGIRKMFCARNAQGELMGALYLVWDGVRAYHLMSARAPEFYRVNVPRLLLWKAIEFATARVPSFDFVGSCVPAIERTFRGFGARQTPFFMASGMNRRLRAFLFARNLLHSALRLPPSTDNPMELA